MSGRALRLGPAWLLAVALLATFVGLVAVSAPPANADQSSQRIRQYVGGRLDASNRSLSANHTCAIAGNGTVHCWGSNSFGQLGYGHMSNVGDVETPAEAGTVDLGPGRTATALTALEGTTCAILDNGAVKCWGLNNYGQLGYGNTTNIGDNETPAAVGTVDLGAGRTAVAISGAGFHTCAILDNGTVKCWGIGSSSELGYGNTNTIGDNETPAAVGTVDLGAGRTAVAIAAGTLHTCAILDNGSVRCWGHNTSGELGVTGVGPYLGDNETPGSVAPINFGTGRTAVAIAAGDSNTCAILDNGGLKCWGANPAGMLGYGTPGSVTLPATVGTVDLGAGRTASAVAMGREQTCAVLDDGSLRCWGNTEWGKLGYGNTPITGGGYIGDNEAPGSVPPLDLGAGRKALTVTAGDAHACAMLDDGTVRCWGLDTTGQTGYALGVFELFNYPAFVIGDNETPGSMGPVDLGEGHGALETVAGGSHSCALFDTGAVRCWGNGADGRLGYANTDNIGDNENVGSAGTVDLDGHGAIQLAAGTSHTCALLNDGTVRCWGNGANGRLGYGSTSNVGDNETPGSAAALNLGGTAIQIAAGSSHTCALLASGAVRCWGNGADGRLGYSNTTTIGDNEAPGSVGPVSLGRSAVSISAGGAHTCAVLDDHTVRCWGSGLNGRLGYAGTAAVGDNEVPSTATVVSMGGSGSDIALGGSHTCSSLVTGPVRCWGNAASGQLGYAATFDIGDNEAPSIAGPVNLGGGANSVSVAAGESHTCAVLANNSVRCWGLGSGGQLGLGSTNTIGDNETPNTVLTVDLGAARTALGVSAGGAHTCATLNEGTVRCWGLNTSGQLGYGNTTTIGDNETPGSAPGVDFEDDLPVAVDDSAVLLEDASAAAINVLTNDTDTDGGPKVVGSKTNGSHGTVAITGGGTGLTYQPAANYCGADSFTYTLNGGSTAAVSITVTCVDDSPVAVNDSTTAAEDSPAGVVDVLGNDTDVDGGAKSIASKTDGSHGTVGLLGGGLGVTYQPVANYCGADSFTYTLNGGSTAMVSVTVTCVDDLPTAVGDSTSVDEDSSATSIDVLTNDTDIDAGPKTISSASDPDHGTVALTGSSGSHTGLTYAPDANYCGADSFTYTLNGGSTATVSVTVTCVDDLPTAVNDSKTLNEDAGATAVDVLANDTNIDGGPKSIASKTDGAHGAVTITGGGSGITYNPAANYCGADSFTYELNGGSSATVSITVTCVDDLPTAVNDSATLSEDSPATAVGVLTNDPDVDGGAKAITATTNGAHGTVATTGGGTGLTYTPTANYCGADSFTYTLNGGSSATVSVSVTCVDDTPLAVNDADTLAEDSPATTIDVLANDTDIDGGPKSIAGKTNGGHGAVALIGAGAGLTYQPAADYCGADSFTYTLNGGSTATVTLTVTCVDDAPTAVDDLASVAEDAAATVINVLSNDTDPDGGAKSIASKTDGAHGTVAITGGGTGLTYQPAANYCGPDSFTYTLNGGSTATVSVTVTCVDDLPTAVADADTVLEGSLAQAIDVLANDTDIDGGPAKTVASKTNGAHGTVAITGGGTGLTYAPDANYCGSDSFSYELNGGSKAIVSVSVTCVDDTPTAVDDSGTVLEDSLNNPIDVLINDTDIDGGPKSIGGKTNGAHGTVTITGGGTGLTYTPDPDYCGLDSFSYVLNGGSSATASVTVTCGDDIPTAVNDSASLTEDASATAIDVLANDTDVDGGSKAVASKTNGTHGMVVITGSGTGLTYQPDLNYCGPDSFTYTLNGGSQANVSLTITCSDDSPSAADDSATVAEDASATAINVLANDTDPDGGPKQITAKTNGAHGAVAITGGGTGLTYQPAANYCGPDSFTYTLNGGSTATVSVTVTCVDDLPTAVADADTVLEGSLAQAIDVLANDTDIDGGPKAITGKTNGSHGTVSLIGAGAGLTYTPEPNYCGADSFTYILNGGSTATVSVSVTCVDEPVPPGGGGDGSNGPSQTTVIQGSDSSGPVVNVTPGVGVVSGRRHPRIAIKGIYAFFTLTCRFTDKDCMGTVTISATVPSIALGPTQSNVVLIKGKFRIAPSRSVLVRAKLTGPGLEVLKEKKTLRGIGARMTIVDAISKERGDIVVNLVKRPKASILPGATK